MFVPSLPTQAAASPRKQPAYVLGAGPKPLPYLPEEDAFKVVEGTYGAPVARRVAFGPDVVRGGGEGGGREAGATPHPLPVTTLRPTEFVETLLTSGALKELAVAGDATKLSDGVYREAYDYAYGAGIRAAVTEGHLRCGIDSGYTRNSIAISRFRT